MFTCAANLDSLLLCTITTLGMMVGDIITTDSTAYIAGHSIICILNNKETDIRWVCGFNAVRTYKHFPFGKSYFILVQYLISLLLSLLCKCRFLYVTLNFCVC